MRTIDEQIDAALAKRDRIIAREGDDNGERRKPSYLRMLVEEEIRIDLQRDKCLKSLQGKLGGLYDDKNKF